VRRDERQVGLALDGGRGDHPAAPRGGRVGRGPPERRLADPGVALDQQRGRSGGERVDEPAHLLERGGAAEEAGPVGRWRHDGHGRGSRGTSVRYARGRGRGVLTSGRDPGRAWAG
jgi:hypothetical protein